MFKGGWVLRESFEAVYGMPTIYKDKIHTSKDQLEIITLPAEKVEEIISDLKNLRLLNRIDRNRVNKDLEILEGRE